MAYIGASIENRVSPKFLKEDFTGDGSASLAGMVAVAYVKYFIPSKV